MENYGNGDHQRQKAEHQNAGFGAEIQSRLGFEIHVQMQSAVDEKKYQQENDHD
jgi:hypothetical protein